MTAADLLARVHTAEAAPALLGAWLAEQHYSRLAVVFDSNVEQLYAERLKPLWPTDAVIGRIPAGEVHKTLATCDQLWGDWFEAGLDRQALVLAIGGGMTTDLVGFAAACWKRGVRFALVPTTLLAMVDATLGGKLGVDFRSGKNLLGAFAQPEAIVIATDFLTTLEPRELRSGYAEVLKHTLLFDADEWAALSRADALRSADWGATVMRSLAHKAAVVAADPHERGPRALLNLGHTLGHALESALLGTPDALLHGEAVALGLVLEAQLAVQHAGLSAAEADTIRMAIERLGYPLRIPTIAPERLAGLLLQDKKNRDGQLRLALLERIGAARYDVAVPLEHALAACATTMR